MHRPLVFASSDLPGTALNRLSDVAELRVAPGGSPLAADALIEASHDADGLICLLSTAVTEEMLSACPRLRIVANYAVGVDNLALEAAARQGIWMTHTPGVLTETTADLAWALLMAAARRIVEGDALLRRGAFHGWLPDLLLGVDVWGKTLGILGMGRIGQAVARRGRGFAMAVIYHNRQPLPAELEEELGARFVSMDELLAESDFLSLHCPGTAETRGLFQAETFRKMKRTAVLINTARGTVLNESALVDALSAGDIRAAGLDVFEREPRVEEGLLRLTNVVMAPHVGSASEATRARMADMVVDDVLAVLKGSPPKHPANRPSPKALLRWKESVLS